jgi:aromatic ring-opening dioxygenase LigB subunit
VPLNYACIAPHGGEVIPKLATRTTLRKFGKTREGMFRLANEISDAKPDTIVIATPHNLRLCGKIGVVTSENSSGRLQASRRSRKSVGLKVKCDREFAKELLYRAAKKGLPVVGANYGGSEGTSSDMPMDWGTLVPLWFVVKGHRHDPKVVIVTPSREIPLTQNFEFGRTIGDLMEKKSKRYAFIASADQAHAHRKSGPYGFSKAAAEYDRLVIDAIEKNRIQSVMHLEKKLVEKAKPDSLWQMTILAGVISAITTHSRLYSYQVPTYYGMICAGFQRTNLSGFRAKAW